MNWSINDTVKHFIHFFVGRKHLYFKKVQDGHKYFFFPPQAHIFISLELKSLLKYE